MLVKRSITRLFSIFLIIGMAFSVLLGSALTVTPAYAAGITVNTTDDELNSDGDCSLREAIQAANTDSPVDLCTGGSGADILTLPAGVYTLAIAGASEDANATGDLDIYGSLTINGAGAGTTTIQAHATAGLGIDRVFDVIATSTLSISGMTIANGKCPSSCSGGGIRNAGTLTVTNSTVSANSADFGGGLYNLSGATLSVTNSTVSGNFVGAFGYGGGIYSEGNLSVTNSTVSGNFAYFGGGLYNYTGATLTVTDSTFSSNWADYGGGVYNFGTQTVSNSTFSGNAAIAGGGLYTLGGTLIMTNSTLSGNSADYGGGISNFNDGTLTVTNSTFSGNGATNSGGGIYNSAAGGILHLKNTILANSTGGGDCYNGSGDSIATNINNLIETNAASPNMCGTPALTDDPGLGALAANGGPTRTFALSASSPALNAGDNSTCSAFPVSGLDQRGITRPQNGACDIGAFESNAQPGPTFDVNSTVDSLDGSCDAFVAGITDCTLREAVMYANLIGGADTINVPAGTYTLTLAGTNDDLNATGDIDINDSATINGAGAGSTIIQAGASPGTGIDRVFDVQGVISVALNGLTIANGACSTCNGGGIRNLSNLSVTNSTFSGNTTGAIGGGIYNLGNLSVSNSTFSGNFAGTGGGAYNGLSLSVTNSTFSNNSASDSGGGLANGSTLTVTNSTLSGNSAANNGGGLYNVNTLHLQNTLLADSSSGGDCYNNSGDAIATNTNNLIETNGPGGHMCGAPAVSGNPDLGGLTGSPAWFPLNPGSPAIDAGDNTVCASPPVSSQSQNGISRPQDGDNDANAVCDIGSFEYATPYIDVAIGGSNQDSYLIDPTTTMSDSYPSMLDGPVSIASGNPDPFLTSQRVTSGASYNELMGVPPSQFTTEYWFPFYDHGYPSVLNNKMRTWILVGNPDDTLTADVDIYIGGTLMNSYSIPPGDNITPRWTGLQDGPVRVVSDIPVFASERVFTVPNNSFNEVMGYPADQFTTEYWFPWYDSVSMNASILVGNTSSSLTADVDIFIGPNFMGNYDILPDETLIQSYPSTVNGPVRVVATNGVDIVASEAALSGPTGSFTAYNEVMGYPFDQFATEYHFPWYDHGYPSVGGSNMRTWILVGNPDDTLTADVDIFIDGALQGSYSVPPNSRITPRWIGLQGGPVRVVSDIPVFTSERVFTSPSNVFNEMMGYPGSQLTTEYWFAWYDSINMSSTILIARP